MAESLKRNRIDGQFFRIKKEKSEIVKTTIDSYLFHRNYPDNKTLKKSVSLEELVSNENVMTKVRRPNSVLLNNSTFRNIFSKDTSIIDIESSFSKLHVWINNIGSDKLKTELLNVISPLFCHLYFDLMNSGFQQSANALLKYYQEQKNILENEIIGQVVKDLICLDFKSRPVVKAFRSAKFAIGVTLEALNILKYFLAKHGHILIIQVFHNWFHFEVLLSEPCSDVDESEEDLMNICNGNVNQEIDLELSDLQDAINAVNNLSPPLLNINVYNSQDKATCGQVNCQYKKVVVGFNTSEIRVWGLANFPILSGEINNEATKIRLACNEVSNNENPFETNPLTPTGAVILRGHSDSVQDVRLVQNDLLLSVSQDCTMRTWNIDDFSCISMYRGHNMPIWSVDVNALDVYIATGSQDSTVKIWTFDRIYPVRACIGHTKDVNCVRFHPNGSYIGSGSSDTIVRMFSLNDEGKCVRMLIGHKGPVYTIAFSSDGMYLASAGVDRCIKIWDITSSKELVELRGPKDVVTDLCWSPNNRHLTVTSLDGLVTVWDANLAVKHGGQQNLQPTSVYDTKHSSLLSINYDKQWLTCLSASCV